MHEKVNSEFLLKHSVIYLDDAVVCADAKEQLYERLELILN